MPKTEGELPQTDYVEEQDENKPIKDDPVNYRDFGNKEDINLSSSVTKALRAVMGHRERPWSKRRSVDPGGHQQALPHSIPGLAWARPSRALWGTGATCTQQGPTAQGWCGGTPLCGACGARAHRGASVG